MKAEYKRDLHHNYLILHGEEQADTNSYQVRMLLANAIPCLLPCRLQSMDGQPLFYYEITSRQSVAAMYEKRKLKEEDLKLLFGGIFHALEVISSFLMNPDQIFLVPEYLYMNAEQKELYFCYLPGYHKAIHQQFREFGEYLLPKIDHQDERAVILGYGIYRKAMEENFQIDEMKEELYGKNGEEKTEGSSERNGAECSEVFRETIEAEPKKKTLQEEDFDREHMKKALEKKVIPAKRKSKKQEWIRMGVILGVTALLAMGAVLGRKLGYLPWLDTPMLLGGILVFGGAGILGNFLWRSWSTRKREPALPGGEESWKEEDLWEQEFEAERRKQASGSGEERKAQEASTGSESLRNSSSGNFSSEKEEKYGETVVLSCSTEPMNASLVSKEPGLLATINLEEELTVIGKLPMAADAVIPLDTVSRIHAKIRKNGEEYYLSDLNSKNGTSVNGNMLKGEDEYCLHNQDEVHFGGAQYIFLK